MMKKPLLLVAMMTSFGVFAADGDDAEVPPITVNGGTVQFKGSLVNAPCTIDTGADGLTVELGQYRTGDFPKTGAISEAKSFNIALSNCAVGTYTTASVKFTGNTVAGDSSKLAVDGGATGVGIQLLSNGNPVEMDSSSNKTSLSEGSNNLRYQAQYISIADNVSAGSANASVDFTVTYK